MNQPPVQLKPHLSYAEQLQLLRTRGLSVEDEGAALAALARYGYYRLSGYWYPLRKTKPVGQSGRLDNFVDGASFEFIVQLADFDKKLRMVVLSAIETIEVALRVAVAYRMGKIHPEAHLTPNVLDAGFCKPKPKATQSEHAIWISKFEAAVEKSREEFVDHHRDKYQGRMPIWVAIELWDFGMLSRLFGGLQSRDRNALSASFMLHDGEVLRSWLRMFNFIRNVAAHHSRLWNRSLPDTPRLPPKEKCRYLEFLHQDSRARSKLFGALTCLRFLLRQVKPDSSWHEELMAHLETFPRSDLLSLESAGFPAKWKDLSIWR